MKILRDSFYKIFLFTYFHWLNHILVLDQHRYHLNHNLHLDHNFPVDQNYSIRDHRRE